MRIIQSYAKNNFGSVYTQDASLDRSFIINFYIALLSYASIKRYAGEITMYTNQAGYDELFQFIPYDKIEIIENPSPDIRYWSQYKVHILSLQKEDFIHTDTDVCIFKPLLDMRSYQAIAQDKSNVSVNEYMAEAWVRENREALLKHDIIIQNHHYHFYYGCGVIGMKQQWTKGYCDMVKQILDLLNKKILTCYDDNYTSAVAEEVTFALYLIKNKITPNVILDPDRYDNQLGLSQIADRAGYLHLWFNNKYKPENILKIKNKIKRDFPEYYKYITEFEFIHKKKLPKTILS